MRKLLQILIVLSVTLGSAASASPGVWNVPSQCPTIQAGIDSASAGDTVIVASGTYYEYDITMKSGITLMSGAGEPDSVIVDADSLGRVMHCTSVDSTACVVGFTIVGGLTGSTWPDDAGAGVRCDSSSLAFINCHFVQNTSGANGGGMFCVSSSPTITDCLFSENSAGQGAGLYCYTDCMPRLTNCDFIGNIADYDAGAMYSYYSSPVLISCDSDSNTAMRDAGGIYSYCSSPVLISCDFDSNTAMRDAGAMYCNGGSAQLDSCTFTGNIADYDAGAIYSYYSSPVLTSCDFDSNTAAGDAGAMYCNGYSVQLDSCTFTGNSANQYAGGLMSLESTVALTHCVLTGNSALNSGGIRCRNSSMSLTDCVLVDNSATAYGGGFTSDDCDPALAHCTFYANSAGLGGAGLALTNSSPTIDNTIIAFGTHTAFHCAGTSNPVLTCCDVYGNAGGDWVDCIAGQDTVSNNFSADPFLCDPEDGDFYLHRDSPCIQGPCGLVGAFGAGCLGFSPSIESIHDVGNDQGRWVRVKWERSFYDASGDTVDITDYVVYRRQDEYLAASRSQGEQALGRRSTLTAPMLSGWDYVATVPPRGDSLYQFVAPTLCDSTDEGTCWSVFFVSAVTPDPLVYFDSDPDSGYSIDNLAPAPPPNLKMTSPAELAWDECQEDDFDYFSVYGSVEPSLDSAAVLIGHTTGTDMDVSQDGYPYYHVTATDFAGNEGDPSDIENMYAGLQDLKDEPMVYALRQNRPNPFDAKTTIAFDIPRDGLISLRVLDVEGRLVNSLAGGVWPAGRHSVIWLGADDRDNLVGPGIYFIRIDAAGFVATKKMVILK